MFCYEPHSNRPPHLATHSTSQITLYLTTADPIPPEWLIPQNSYDYSFTMSNKQIEHRWTVEKNILTRHSPYFTAMLDCDFYEACLPLVELPCGILTAHGVDGVLQVLYSPDNWPLPTTNKLKWLQEMNHTADYFSMNQLGDEIGHCLASLVHSWTCACDDCSDLIPQLFAHASQYGPPDLYTHSLQAITQDPERCLQTMWTQPSMARILDESDAILMLLQQRVCHHINQSNAIESLHACFIATQRLAQLDPVLCWCKSLQSVLGSAQTRSTAEIATHFDYYISRYPTLQSCIDGISYSFEFLEYLLEHLLEDQMDPSNAGWLYQGLVRDLMCRHSVRQNSQVRHILNNAKKVILEYIAHRLHAIVALDALDRLDTAVLKALAVELDIPAPDLVKTMNKHQGLVRPSLLSTLFPPPKITCPRIKRQSEVTTYGKKKGLWSKWWWQLDTPAHRKAKSIALGKRVQLNRRPVLTIGTVKYIGPVGFAQGIWAGVELDRRVGKNDGSIQGERYFTTSPNRGVFVRSDDLQVIF